MIEYRIISGDTCEAVTKEVNELLNDAKDQWSLAGQLTVVPVVTDGNTVGILVAQPMMGDVG